MHHRKSKRMALYSGVSQGTNSFDIITSMRTRNFRNLKWQYKHFNCGKFVDFKDFMNAAHI